MPYSKLTLGMDSYTKLALELVWEFDLSSQDAHMAGKYQIKTFQCYKYKNSVKTTKLNFFPTVNFFYILCFKASHGP